jgi:hypothetical protein
MCFCGLAKAKAQDLQLDLDEVFGKWESWKFGRFEGWMGFVGLLNWV